MAINNFASNHLLFTPSAADATPPPSTGEDGEGLKRVLGKHNVFINP
jgi:hypothetical protein